MATSRTKYFAGVCAGIFAIGLLLLAFAAHAHAATTYTLNDGCQTRGGTVTNDVGQPPISGTVVTVAGFWSITYVSSTAGGHISSSPSPMGYSCPAFGGGTFFGTGGSSGAKDLQALLPGNPAGDGLYVVYSGQMGYYAFAQMTGGVVTVYGANPTPPAPLVTSITLTQPTQGTTTPTTTLDIAADYTVGDDLPNFSLDGSLPSQIGIRLTLQNNTTGGTINLGTDFSIATSTGTHTYATTTVQTQGDYTLIAELVGIYGTYLPAPPDCTPLPPFQTCSGTTQSTATLATSLPPPTFSLANGTFPLLGFTVGSSTSRNGLATTTCSITAIGGCFQNALAFLFYPTASLDQFSTLWQTVQNKPPFGYVSQTLNSLRSLNASSTPAFSFGTLPLMDSIFTPFRTGLSALLWLGFFIVFYRGRLRHLDI